ncbi:uncharacterized protein LOC131857752 [Cryptomeria japonica]|uniref:uncharacterized protein LOC131857752 n=1 Tax=Cryptomeria japonica TaxID=3369 RepID=UPI0027DA92A9|nr:uncharacterized protein LOC131857752 [Cryptomeria japonica]
MNATIKAHRDKLKEDTTMHQGLMVYYHLKANQIAHPQLSISDSEEEGSDSDFSMGDEFESDSKSETEESLEDSEVELGKKRKKRKDPNINQKVEEEITGEGFNQSVGGNAKHITGGDVPNTKQTKAGKFMAEYVDDLGKTVTRVEEIRDALNPRFKQVEKVLEEIKTNDNAMDQRMADTNNKLNKIETYLRSITEQSHNILKALTDNTKVLISKMENEKESLELEPDMEGMGDVQGPRMRTRDKDTNGKIDVASEPLVIDNTEGKLAVGNIEQQAEQQAEQQVHIETFLIDALRKFGFSNEWITWVNSFLSSVKFSVLVNGSSHGFFPTSKGIRQGDPMSPFLFIIMAEALGRTIRNLHLNGSWQGVNVANGVEHTTHLQFIDDTILFGAACRKEAKTIKTSLEDYCKVSGQKINWHKSEVYFNNTPLALQGNPGQSGIGCIMRSSDGRSLREVSERIGIATNNEAEFRATLRGLQLGIEMGIQHIHLEGDSLNVVNAIRHCSTPSWQLNQWLQPILKLLMKFEEFRISHIYREGNEEADRLSKPETDVLDNIDGNHHTPLPQNYYMSHGNGAEAEGIALEPNMGIIADGALAEDTNWGFG